MTKTSFEGGAKRLALHKGGAHQKSEPGSEGTLKSPKKKGGTGTNNHRNCGVTIIISRCADEFKKGKKKIKRGHPSGVACFIHRLER